MRTISTVLFVSYVGVLVPLGSWRSMHQIRSASRATIDRRQLYLSAMIAQALLFILAWMTARAEQLRPLAVGRIGAGAIGIGVLWVAVKFARFSMVMSRPGAYDKRPVLRALAPGKPADYLPFTVVCVMAGLGEELAYRGVLFQLLTEWVGGWWIPALAVAIVFGAAHFAQGEKAAAWAGLLGLGNQVVVLVTGTLWVAIVAHAVSDFIVGVTVATRMPRQTTASADG